jgi:hypothetical protein
MSTINASTVNASVLSNVTEIKDTLGITRLAVNTTEPVLTVGNGTNIIKAKNTAKFFIQCSDYGGIITSYNIASIADQGSTILRVDYITPAATQSYSIAVSWGHYGGVTWQLIANYPGLPQPTYFTLRFHYGTGGSNGVPAGTGWGAVGFGDQ